MDKSLLALLQPGWIHPQKYPSTAMNAVAYEWFQAGQQFRPQIIDNLLIAAMVFFGAAYLPT